MKSIILLLAFSTLSLGACSHKGLIYRGSTTEGYLPVSANSSKYQKQKKARWKHNAKRAGKYASYR